MLPWKTINGGIKRHENHICQERKNPIGNPWHRVLLLDHKLNAFQRSGKAYRKRDVPAGTDDNMRIEFPYFLMTLDQAFDQTDGEQEVSKGDERAG